MLFEEKMQEVTLIFPEDMSATGKLVLVKSIAGYSFCVHPSEKSKLQSGSIEFCSSGIRNQTLYKLLRTMSSEMSSLSENSELRRIKVRTGNDGDIRIFITTRATDRLMLNPEDSQEFSFLRDLPEHETFISLFDHFFESQKA